MKDKEKQEQIEEMAKHGCYDGCASGLRKFCEEYDGSPCKNMIRIARGLFEKGYRKLPKDSVVISKEEYEMLANQYKNLEIKYSNLCDNYRLCKDANETLKQKVIIARKEIAEKFYDKVNENICVFQLENKNQEFTDGYAQAIADICGRLDQVAKQFGVEIEENNNER